MLGVLTLMPYRYWRRTHAVHHGAAGDLDRRGLGDIATLTVREYLELSRWGRLKYRVYRNPLVFGPSIQFILKHRSILTQRATEADGSATGAIEK